MKKNAFFGCICLIFLLSIACAPESSDGSGDPDLNIIGTWKLLSSQTIQAGDTTRISFSGDQEMIKILNPSHFAFLRHDLRKGQDSAAVFVAGGGKFTLSGNQYTEYLDYCNFREWEGHTFEFELTLTGDTLIQKGIEKVEAIGVDREITETYVRL